jgi:hypothetical protein
VGTKAKPVARRDPNYTGCVPIRVIGTDIYDLDRDNDGIACE